MKAICINGKPNNPYALPIPEMVPLNVYECHFEDCYIVENFELGTDGLPIYHYKHRFIPLTDIDETTQVNNKQEEYACTESRICLTEIQHKHTGLLL